jgi:tetratricopeptide (TPR) repeat protein
MGGVPGGDVNRAKLALQMGRPDEAARLMRKWVERRPNDYSARLILAQALLQMQQVDDALVEARRVTKEQPTNADGFLLLSAALSQKQSRAGKEAAEEAARRAVQLQPRWARTHVQLAEALMARQDLKAAREEADEAIKLEPRLAAAHLIKGLAQLSDKDPEGAISSCEAALRYDSNLFAAHFALANALVETKRYDEALVALNRAQQLNPMLPQSQFDGLRGRILVKQRKFGAAYRLYLGNARQGRVKWLAPFVAALSMTSYFGQYAPAIVLVVLVLAVIFGIGFIPVVGPWLSVLLLLGVVGVSFFGALRQYNGSILPTDSQRIPALVSTVVAGVAFLAVGIWLGDTIAHASVPTPVIFFIAGILALIVAVGVAYFWPRLGSLGQLGRRRAPRARA